MCLPRHFSPERPSTSRTYVGAETKASIFRGANTKEQANTKLRFYTSCRINRETCPYSPLFQTAGRSIVKTAPPCGPLAAVRLPPWSRTKP